MAVAMNPDIMRRMIKLMISTLMLAVAMYLIIWWFVTPTMLGWTIETLVTQHTQKFGDMVGVYILYTCPVIILALLGTLHLHLTKKCPPPLMIKSKKSSSIDSFYARASRMWRMLWTRPVFINRVFGVMVVVDVVAIISTFVLVFWLFYAWYVPQAKSIDAVSSTTGAEKVVAKTAQAGTMLGRVSVVLMSLILLPVTRNSPILRMLGLPFEHAVKFHKWMGYLLVAVILAHGGSFIGVYAKTHTWHRLISFTNALSGVVVVPGLVAFLVAIYMVVTSLPTIRRRHFNLFYYSHQLYVVFFAGFVYHVGVRTAGYTMGPIFLFFLDRFMRFWQSRQLIQISRARVSFDGIIELKVPRSSTLTHDALSFMFLKVPGVSHLEWHPISVASSARDYAAGEMTILIKKVTGTSAADSSSWTSRVVAHVTEVATTAIEKKCPFSMPVAVEGPYSDESEYYLNYKTLVLVAGGIGITPFMAIIQDILHRYRITAHDERAHLPQNIILIWSVRSETELDILRQVSPSLIFRDYESGACRIYVKAFVTRFQTNKAYVNNDNVDNNLGGAIHVISAPGPDDDNLTDTSRRVRSVAGAGDNLWMFWMILITSCATIATFEGINVVPRNTPYFQWIQGSLLFVSMFVGIVVAGSAVLLCWTAHSKSKERKLMEIQTRAARIVGSYENELSSVVDDMEWAHPTLYDIAEGYMFSRPDFSREFDQVVKDFGHEDVGVLVSGPEGLQHLVAKECQRRSGLRATLKAENFNYHSVSFSL